MKMTLDEYSTKDLAEASFLYASGCRFTNSENNNGIIWFSFADKEKCQKLADAFWRKEAVVNAREFYNSLRTLKDLIFNRAKH